MTEPTVDAKGLTVVYLDGTEPIALKDCIKGEFIKRKADSNRVWIRGDYNRVSKRYSVTAFDDANKELLLRGDTVVFVGFTF